MDSTNESITDALSLNKKRAEHLRILKRELKILERLEREGKKENIRTESASKLATTPKNSRKSSRSSAVTANCLASPTRKLSYSKRSHAHQDISKVGFFKMYMEIFFGTLL